MLGRGTVCRPGSRTDPVLAKVQASEANAVVVEVKASDADAVMVEVKALDTDAVMVEDRTAGVPNTYARTSLYLWRALLRERRSGDLGFESWAIRVKLQIVTRTIAGGPRM